MDTIKIKFGNSDGYMIKNNRVKHDILKKLKDLYNIEPINIIEKSYSDKLLDPILNADTLVCFISTGIRYIVYLTKIYNECTTILISTSANNIENGYPRMIVIPLSISEQLFNETIIYSELIQNKVLNTWSLYLERMVVYNGQMMYAKSNLEQLKLIYNIYENKFKATLLDAFTIRVKKYITVRQIEENLKTIEYNIIGIRFYTLRSPIVFYFYTSYYDKIKSEIIKLPDNFDNKILELKTKLLEDSMGETNKNNNIEVEDTTCLDNKFIVIMKPSVHYGIYNIYTENNSILVYIGVSRIPTIELNQFFHKYFKTHSISKVYCKYNYIFDKFEIYGNITNNENTTNFKDIEKYINKCNVLEKPNYVLDE